MPIKFIEIGIGLKSLAKVPVKGVGGGQKKIYVGFTQIGMLLYLWQGYNESSQKPVCFIFLIQVHHVSIDGKFYFYLMFYDVRLVVSY